MKYRLALHLYGDFFKYQLGPKLSDFLIEERRREKKKKSKTSKCNRFRYNDSTTDE
jgi:hypothetical protein